MTNIQGGVASTDLASGGTSQCAPRHDRDAPTLRRVRNLHGDAAANVVTIDERQMRAFSMAARRRHDVPGRVARAVGGPLGVEQIMTAGIACVGESASMDDLRELLVERGQHCVPVVAAQGRPIGVITQTDLLRIVGRAEADMEGEPHGGEAARRARELTAGDIMTSMVFALPVTASIEQAAALMAYEGVEQIVVTGMGGEVAGVVRALDVARRCARSAGYLVDREG
jgi:CBS-domain-containing membrane protein